MTELINTCWLIITGQWTEITIECMNAAVKNVLAHGFDSDDHYKEKRSNYLSAEELNLHLQGCIMNDRLSQNKIYNSFYNYALTICSIYTYNYDDSVEILNDGFLKVFKELYRYQPAFKDTIQSFKGWLRRIMVYKAIDRFRKNRKHKFYQNIR